MMLKKRTQKEIEHEIDFLVDFTWYNRCHLCVKQEIKDKILKIVPDKNYDSKIHNTIGRSHWNDCLEAAKKVRAKWGRKILFKGNDFDWGMLMGKLSALRWQQGWDWDFLDT